MSEHDQRPADGTSTAGKVFDATTSVIYGLLWLVVTIIGVVGIFLPHTLWYGLAAAAIGGFYAWRNFSRALRR
jgi:hypothetical protein